MHYSKQSKTTRKDPARGKKRLEPSLKNMGVLLKRNGVELKYPTLQKLWQFHQLLRENNKDQDLSRLNAFETMIERHYADCMIIGAFIKKWPKKMLDVGSGAGFPGIPTKLLQPDMEMILCEPRPKRVQFLNLAVKELHLKKIKVFGHKVTSKSMTESVDGVMTRAFETIQKTIPRIDTALQSGGRIYFMKGPAARQEIEDFNIPGYEIEDVHWYTIPNSTQDRSLVIVKKL